MIDAEKLKYAKEYIDKMVQGINPLTDREIAEGDLLNNVHITRCLVFVSDVLRQVIENGGSPSYPRTRKEKKPAFFLTDVQKTWLYPTEDYAFAKQITDQINEVAEENACQKFQAKWITEFFLRLGMMEVIDGKKRATEAGQSIGIRSELRTNTPYGDYWANLYSPQAQQFLFDHIDAVIDRSPTDERSEHE
ncbi:MAG: hypothetical protein NC084_04415 [Bacteroides sp.]|nr:hypothetical protein [Eubacterium sp.]MCM1417894.1 hypothetical protein [Roseburia sp.]MCM1461942.1 hypothetical protein [Bacteroides sp.]